MSLIEAMTREELIAEVKWLRRLALRRADDAEWAVTQEGAKVHDACEGHAVCDLVAGTIFDAKKIRGEL